MTVKEIHERLKAAVAQKFKMAGAPTLSEIPKPSKTSTDEVAGFVEGLFEEGLSYAQDHFRQTMKTRPTGYMGTSQLGSPEVFYDACDMLEANRDWEVWGRRNQGAENQWKQERVDGLIARNMRVRRRYIASQWHEVSIQPNVGNFTEIFDAERKKNGWGTWVKEYIHQTQLYGTSTTRLFLDLTEDPDGIVRPINTERGTVVKSPFATSYKLADGCWYVVHGTMVNGQQAEHEYPGIKLEEMNASESLSDKFPLRDEHTAKSPSDYQHTVMFAKLEVFLDDPTLEKLKLTPEEAKDIEDEIQVMLSGDGIMAEENQHHVEHINQKMAYLEQLLASAGTVDPYLVAITSALSDNINAHLEFMREDDLQSLGLRKAYPYGRYIVTIGGRVVQDDPNPWEVPWRMLFHDLTNETVVGRNDGRGDPEILWEEAKSLDAQLSRIEDLALLNIPKKYRHISDKEVPGVLPEMGVDDDTDPFKTSFYAQTAPSFSNAREPRALFELYNIRSARAEQTLGVNQITIGGEPDKQTSGYQTALLQRANETVVTGEIDENLRYTLENIVEGMIELYKVHYKEPRRYYINGVATSINVSQRLTFVEEYNPETDVIEKIPLGKLEIVVKPFSNFPNKWELDFEFLMGLSASGLVDMFGLPIVPVTVLRDMLAQKYPEFKQNGRYGMIISALQQATAAAAQQQKKEEEMARTERAQQGALASAEKKFISKKESERKNGQKKKASARSSGG